MPKDTEIFFQFFSTLLGLHLGWGGLLKSSLNTKNKALQTYLILWGTLLLFCGVYLEHTVGPKC